jgi:hypothetical protein
VTAEKDEAGDDDWVVRRSLTDSLGPRINCEKWDAPEPIKATGIWDAGS